MKAFHIITVGDKEFRLKLTTATKIEAEKRLGFSLIEAPEQIMKAETFAIVLWAALQKFQSNYPLTKVYDLIDDMEDAGVAIGEKADILLEIMKVSGFFTQTQLEEMDAETAKKAEQGSE